MNVGAGSAARLLCKEVSLGRTAGVHVRKQTVLDPRVAQLSTLLSFARSSRHHRLQDTVNRSRLGAQAWTVVGRSDSC